MLRDRLPGTKPATLFVIIAILLSATGLWAQSGFKNLYDFTGGKEGDWPASLIFDSAGNLYGAAAGGGDRSQCLGAGCGFGFKFLPKDGGAWERDGLLFFAG